MPSSRKHGEALMIFGASGGIGHLAGQHVPAIYGPSGDVQWDEADPTYSLAAARRGG